VGAFLLASLAGSTSFNLITNPVAWLTTPDYTKTLAGWGSGSPSGCLVICQLGSSSATPLVSYTVFTLAFIVASCSWPKSSTVPTPSLISKHCRVAGALNAPSVARFANDTWCVILKPRKPALQPESTSQ
jgi:hypothetical protein